MKIRKTTIGGDEGVNINMTPMIDVVFQLLVFFIFTFKIVQQEGDFNITMPQTAATPGPPSSNLPPFRVQMTAHPGGSLAELKLADSVLGSFPPIAESDDPDANARNEATKEAIRRQFFKGALRQRILDTVGYNTGPNSPAANAKVELDCDRHLNYEWVIAAVTAVSGEIDPVKKQRVPIIEQIEFKPRLQ
jgi:biopolymer transport protein ExbD